MSDNTKNEKESLFLLNHITKVIGHNYFLCALIVIGSFALGIMDSYAGIGAALGTGIGYGFVQRKKGGFIRGFLIGASLVLIAVCWGQYQGHTSAQKVSKDGALNTTLSFEETLSEVAIAIRKKLPITIDEDTVMTSIEASGTLLTQALIFTNYNFDQIDVAELSKAMRPFIISTLCTKQDTREFLKMGAKYHLIYSSNDNKYLFDINIDINKCS